MCVSVCVVCVCGGSVCEFVCGGIVCVCVCVCGGSVCVVCVYECGGCG